MSEAIELKSGWCEDKQVYCSSRQRCEDDRSQAVNRIRSTIPPSGFFNRLLTMMGQASGGAVPVTSEIDPKEELDKIILLDQLLVRNCGAVCIIDDALETIEFRELNPVEQL